MGLDSLKVRQTSLPGVLVIEPEVFSDTRGYFFESYRSDRYAEAGISEPFVQDNVSRSEKGVLRGLHLQNPNPQGKLVHVLEGEVFDVAVDMREGSPTFAHWTGILLSSENKLQFYLPEGFAHGFCVLSDTALFTYKCTNAYDPESELSVAWNDPAIGIQWPLEAPLLSPKDAGAPLLADIAPGRLPGYA